jgi:hypothetical protein
MLRPASIAHMNIFFDVDQTIIATSNELRPGVKELFAELTRCGHTLYLWSGIGVRWEVVERHGLGEWVSGCFEKPMSRFDELLAPLGIPVRPDFVVDDHEGPVRHFGGVVVKRFLIYNPDDRDLERVRAAIDRHLVR